MGKIKLTESQLLNVVKRVLREYSEFGDESWKWDDNVDKLADLDKGGKTKYIFFNELKRENGFSVENDLGVVGDNMSFSEIKAFMMKNSNTMYLDQIRDFNTFDEFLNDYKIRQRRSHSRRIN